jgi:pimeloyl-ACP methyl ester carboxylesterase
VPQLSARLLGSNVNCRKDFMKPLLLATTLCFMTFGCNSTKSQNPVSSTSNNAYSYSIDSVSFGDNTQPLKGVLFTPNSNSSVPALIIIQGSGPVDMDGLSAGITFPAYKVWAESLTVSGIAVLRYNKHYMTYPQDPLSITESTQVADIIKAEDFLKTRVKINPGKIFVLGHSEGGSLAPVAASWQHGLFAGIICAAATAIPVDTLFCMQLKAQGVSSSLISQTQTAFEAVRNGTAPSNGYIWGAGIQYWKEWILYSEKADSFLLASNVPALILQGLSDENYPDSALSMNISRWQGICNKSSNFSFQTFLGDSHFFLDPTRSKIDVNFINAIKIWIQTK